MEDIEYLEEYEDLVLPALNSAAAVAAAPSVSSQINNNFQSQKINDDGDDSSSSLDQDIFNCLFDDNSDDEDFNDYQKSDAEPALNTKSGSHEIIETLEDNIEEIGEKLIQKVEISRQDQTNNFATIPKAENKIISSQPKPKSFMTKTSGTTIPLITTKANTAKSIATVRPTVQNQEEQSNLQKKSNLLYRPVSSTSSLIQRQNPSTSAASTSCKTVQLPISARKPLSSSTSLSNSTLVNKKSPLQSLSTPVVNKVTKRPATIVKPEKIITKDPVNDPLDLDDISEAESDNYSLSDISGETYNSISDFEDEYSDDEYYSGDGDYYEEEDYEDGISSSSQVIEISNDSSGAPSNLEDLRASTASPVISEDSDTHSSASGYKISKTKAINPYSHPDIIESVLRKGEKPKLLELLHTHNLLEDSVEKEEGDNIFIDITTSADNLVENLDTPKLATSKNTSSSITTTIVDPVDLNLTENNKSLTNQNPTKHSKKTNKNKLKKKSEKNMDQSNESRDLKSPGAVSTDSDLSAVEELLEESYAEAMKRVKNVPYSNPEMEAEMEIGGEEEVIATEETQQKLPKTGVVIDYDDIHIENPAGINKIEETKTENAEKDDTRQKEIEAKKVDKKSIDLQEPKSLLESETTENVDIKSIEINNQLEIIDIESKEANKQSELIDCSLDQKDIEGNLESKNENVTGGDFNAANTESQITTKLLDNVKSNASDSPNTRKKKRFRNLITPEPKERCTEAATSIDDINEFKGFEEVQTNENVEMIQTNKNPQLVEETQKKTANVRGISEKDLATGSFKSPSSSHQSLKDKAKETKDKISRDNSKESKEKSAKHTQSKSSRDNSKDRHSRESSKDKSSRESSKDRSRESSKERSKHSHDKDSTSKHHRKDHRKSSDSNKSRESSKSRDSKETTNSKADTSDCHKSTSFKKDQPSERNVEKSTEKKDLKPSKETDKAKDIVKSSTESKNSNERDNKKDLKEHKRSLEKKDKKPTDTVQRPKEKDSSKSLGTPAKDQKQNNHKDAHKSSSSNKNVIKKLDCITKSSTEIKMSENTKNPKSPTDLIKTVTNKPSNSTSVDNVQLSKTNSKPTDNKNMDKILNKSIETANASVSVQPLAKSENPKKTIQKPAISNYDKLSATDLGISKSSTKSNEADKKEPQKISSLDCKKTVKTEDETKKSKDVMNKSFNASKSTNKDTSKSDVSNKTKQQTPIKNIPKETVGTDSSMKRHENSITKSGNIETKCTTVTKPISQVVQKDKTVVKPDEARPKEKSTDLKNSTETSKTTKVSEKKNKDAKNISILQKKSFKPKEENIGKTEATDSNKPTISKTKEDSKSLDKATSQESEKSTTTETKTDENKTKDNKETVNLIKRPEKSQNDPRKNQDTKNKSDVNETNKSKTIPKPKEENLSKTQVTANNQTPKKTKDSKSEIKEENFKATKEKPNDKETDKNYTTIQSKTEKTKVLQFSTNEQKDKEQETHTKGKNEPRKSGNTNDSTARKGTTQVSSTNKDKIKENITTEKAKVSTAKSVKPSLKQSATISKTDPIASVKAVKQITELKHYSQEAEVKDVPSIQENKIEVREAVESTNLGQSCVEPTKNDESSEENKQEAVKLQGHLEDVKTKGSDITNQMGSKISKESLNKQIKVNENVIKKASDTEVDAMKIEEPCKVILKNTENRVSQEIIDDNSSGSTEPRQKRSRMENLIATEPINSIQPADINVAADMEPRITRSRNESLKLNDPIANENVETGKVKKLNESMGLETIDKNKNDKPEDGKHNLELNKASKKTTIKTESVKPVSADKTDVLREVSKPSEDKILSADNSNKKIVEVNFVPMQTRKRGDLKRKTEKDKISHEDLPKEKSSLQSTTEEIVESNKGITRADHKVEKMVEPMVELSDGKDLVVKDIEEHNFKPMKTRRRQDHEEQTPSEKEKELDKTSTDGSCGEKSSTQKAEKEELTETIKTRRVGDIKVETKKDKTKISHDQILNEKSSAEIQPEKPNIDPLTIGSVAAFKEETRNDKIENLQTELLEEKTSTPKETEGYIEPLKTRSRGDPKEVAGKAKSEKMESSDEKTSIQNVSEKTIKTRRRGDVVKEKLENETKDTSNIESSDKGTQNKAGEHTEPIKTRRLGREKCETPQDKLSHEKTKGLEILKEGAVKEKMETSQIVPSDKNVSDKKITGHLEYIITRKRGDIKAKADRDKNEISNIEKTKEKIVVPDESKNQMEEQYLVKRKSKGRGDIKEEKEKVTDGILQKIQSLDQVEDKKSSENKNLTDETLKITTEENVIPTVIRNCGDAKKLCEKGKIQISQDDAQNQSKQKQSTFSKTRRGAEEVNQNIAYSAEKDQSEPSQNEKTKSTADKKEPEAINTKATSDNDKQQQTSTVTTEQFEPSANNTQLETNLDTSKITLEISSLETEVSASESSITLSNSDNTLRRTLRKRGTDSPFPDNDNNKKSFKEPPLKSTMQFTPKNTKTEKASYVLSSNMKRSLRSPASDTESPSPTKRPKLETSKKSTRFRNLHDVCAEEEELPIVTAEPSDHLQQQQAVLNKQNLSEPATITKEVKGTTKNIAISEQKAEEKLKDAKTPQTSTNIHQSEVQAKEVSKQRANKEGLNTKKTLRLEETKSKEDKDENVANVGQETPCKAKINPAKVNTTPNKSTGSTAVMSFSDWLKTKNQNPTDEVKNEFITATAKEGTSDVLKRQCRVKLTLTISDSKSTVDKEKTLDLPKMSQEDITMICQNKKKDIALKEKQEEISFIEEQKTAEKDDTSSFQIINVSRQLENNLLQLSENRSQTPLKQQKGKKANVKRLQTSSKTSKKSKVQTSRTSPSSSITTPPRIKKTETDLLIESMSKEMKDGGIKDLLNAEKHVKRQRLSMKRNKSGSAEHLKSSSINKTSAAAVVQLPKARPSGLMLNEQIPKVLDFSENVDILPTIPTHKEVSKSPTKLKPQKNYGKSKKSAKKCIDNTPDNIATVEQALLHEEPKAVASKFRQSLNVKGNPRGFSKIEKDTKDFATAGLLKSRKSIPLMSKEAREQLEIHKSNIFKTPKNTGHSTILNQIPSAESIKKLYAEDKRSDSNIKMMDQTESLLRKFNCRTLRVRLDRSIVDDYWSSISNLESQILARTRTVLGNETPASSVNAIPIIQNNSETNLRIQKVIEASSASSIPMADTQDSLGQTHRIPNAKSNTIPDIQQHPHILPNVAETIVAPLNALVNIADGSETIELKNEFMDENPIGLINEAILPDTPALLARAQSITQAAQHALCSSVTPTDIRLLTTDSTENNFVPSFGVTPTALDNRGTCMYTFLHPAKYNRNHSNVLLDYCCPNLDGPMPAIDPTRIHAQVQVPVVELPASIVLTTKVVTRADLERENSTVPAIIRKKAEKIRKNMATHHKLAVATSTVNTQPPVPVMAQPHLAPTPRPTLPATINALTKQLPATTTITAKIRPPLPQQLVTQPPNQPPTSNLAPPVTSTIPKNTIVSVIPKTHLSQLSNVQQSNLRSNLRRFDVMLKQLVQPYESLSFVERHRIMEAVIVSGKFVAKDLEQTLVLMEDYIKQTLLLKNDSLSQPLDTPTSAILSTNNFVTPQVPVASPLPTAQMPQLQPSPKILASTNPPTAANPYSRQLEQIHNKAVRKAQSRNTNTSLTSGAATDGPSGGIIIKQRQVPIYDTDRNIIGYQMRMMTPTSTMPAYTKSTMSTHTGAIMSTSLDSSSKNITGYSINKRPVKRPAQDSPRVFYTTPPLKTSTPKAVANIQTYPSQQSRNTNTIAQKTQGSIVTTLRSGASSSSANSETITTTTTATVKRVTRSRATGSKIIIVSKSNQSSEETILPDTSSTQQETEHLEIKNEEDVEDFLG